MLEKLSYKKDKSVVVNIIFSIIFLFIMLFPKLQFVTKLLALCELFFVYVITNGLLKYGVKNSFRTALSGKKPKILLSILIFSFFIILLLLQMKCSGYAAMFTLYICVTSVFFTGLLAAYFSVFSCEKDIVQACILLLVATGFSFMTIIPIGLVPDEGMHSFTAYRISNKILGIQDSYEKTSFRQSDSEYPFMNQSGYYSNEKYENYFSQMNNGDVNSNMIELEVPYVVGTDSLYIVPAIGITVGRILSLNALQTFMLGRICNFLFYLAGIVYLLKKTVYKKNVLLVMAMLPVFVQQGIAITYDVPINLMLLLIVTFTINLNFEKNNLNIFDKFLLLLSCFIICKVKSHAYVLIGLLPVLCFLGKKISNSKYRKRILYTGGIACLLGIIGIFLIASKLTVQNLKETDSYTILFLLQNPKEIFAIAYNSFMESGSFYIDTFIGRYLGYLDIPLHPLIVYGYYILLILVVIPNSEERYLIPTYEKIVLLFAGILTGLFTIGGMLLACSKVGDRMVLGMQGRYLLATMFILCLVIHPKFIRSNSCFSRYAVSFLMMLELGTVVYLMLVL